MLCDKVLLDINKFNESVIRSLESAEGFDSFAAYVSETLYEDISCSDWLCHRNDETK